MNLSKKSWHYRLLRFTDTMPSDNLCPYVRQVFGSIGLLFLLAVLAIGAVVALSYPIWRHWSTDGLVGFSSFLLWIGVGWLALKIYREEWNSSKRIFDRWAINPDYPLEYSTFDMTMFYHRDLWPKAISEKIDSIRVARAAKPPNIFVEYARAAHNKICPGLRFSDE